MTNTADPEDLLGSGAALVRTTTNYTTCVREAIDAALVPRGAQVLLVGHSEGGIVAMDLAGDPAFNGGRVRVNQVVAAGSPISSKPVAAGSGTRVLSIENVNDIVTHLDAADPPATRQSLQRLTYRFARRRARHRGQPQRVAVRAPGGSPGGIPEPADHRRPGGFTPVYGGFGDHDGLHPA